MPTRIGFDESVDTYGVLFFFDLLVDLFFIVGVFLSSPLSPGRDLIPSHSPYNRNANLIAR